jgi:formate hydrogenlyase subunit 3/multisubunit Na+/H+ antiporter MnhD subunit
MSLIFLIVIPFVAAVPVYFLRGYRAVAAFVSLGTTLLLVGFCSRAPLNEPAYILGRELVLDDLNRFLLIFILGLAAVIVLYSWPASQGREFFPLLLLILGLLSAAIMIRNFLIAVLLLEIAGLVFVFMIYGERPVAVGTALGYLVPLVVAIACLLPVSWLIDSHALHPENQLSIRFTVILLAAVPLHSWLPAVAEEAPSMASATLLCIFNLVTLGLLLGLLNSHLWLTADSDALSVISVAGLLTALGGGVLAFAQPRPARLLGYAAISDMGFVLVGLGTGSLTGVTGGLAHAISRSLSVLLVAMSVRALRTSLTSGSVSTLREGLRRTPGSIVGYIIGGLALGGFPLSNGFATRWLIYRSLPGDDRVYLWALLLAGSGVVLGFLRSLFLMLRPSPGLKTEREPLTVTVVTLSLALLCLVIGLAPGLIADPLANMVESMIFIGGG